MIINYKGVALHVGFDYQPEEKAETGIEAQYPGCGESISIHSIAHIGVDLMELLEDSLEEIEEIILETIITERTFNGNRS